MDVSSILRGEQFAKPVVGSPNLMVLSGKPGCGKTTLSAGLNKNGYTCLVLDSQNGAGHVGGHIVNLRNIAEEYKISPLQAFEQVTKSLSNLKRGVKLVKNAEGVTVEEKTPVVEWDFIWVDPLSYLQPLITEKAAFYYNNSVIGKAKAKQLALDKFGKSFTAAHVKMCESKDPVGDPDNNAGQNGWSFMKLAFTEIFTTLRGLPTKCLIFCAHTKYNKIKSTNIEELDMKGLDFWPTYAAFLVAEASDSCQVSMEGSAKVYLNFAVTDNSEIFKSRNFPEQKILISEKRDGELIFYWEEIFPFLNTPKHGG